ncbi:hypothetical protein [Spirosoma oryzicola]|uniref:hypothetical protein n=1 Tax=Spirosoma oryzicola TaxID=2898794 RepID=UPI001E3CFA43|nr:hypothetical protein [Spirosoma oryzicola]UHG89557.1 hypothetical protein LQ777_15025 [Spirosoma oryzicola]
MKLIDKVKAVLNEIYRVKEDNKAIRLVIGAALARTVPQAKSLKDAEFKVFSQFGDDGIIQYLINHVKPKIDTFVEFGVENYEESNTRFLLMNNNWRGLILDGSPAHIEYIKNRSFFWQYDLTAIASFITAENINQLLAENGVSGQIGLLSIDIDGNDYWVWKAIKAVEADIVIAEYNSLFGAERAITVPYKADFVRTGEHYSNLYFGASLTALHDLAAEKGYSFVGCNQAGNNAYFVKNDKLNGLPPLSVADGFVAARFRESRSETGLLTLLNEKNRREMIENLPVINTRNGKQELL